MSLLVDLIRVVAALNLVLLLGLTYVWGRNWLDLRSKHALGLLLFATFLLGENALALYFFMVHETLTGWITDPTMVPGIAQQAMVSLRILEFVGLAFLAWVTWD